jgi:hypothetical protein
MHPHELADLGHIALPPKNTALRIEPAGQPVEGDALRVFPALGRIDHRRHRMVVRDEIETLAPGSAHRWRDASRQIVADVQGAGGRDAGEVLRMDTGSMKKSGASRHRPVARKLKRVFAQSRRGIVERYDGARVRDGRRRQVPPNASGWASRARVCPSMEPGLSTALQPTSALSPEDGAKLPQTGLVRSPRRHAPRSVF